MKNTAREHLEVLVEDMIWMSGASSFDPGAEGHDAWAKPDGVRDHLFAAMDYLDSVTPNAPEVFEQLELFDPNDFDHTWKDD
jgi:hypothetical protein